MRRRAFLAALPAFATVPGCLGGSTVQNTDAPDPETTASPPPSESPTPNRTPVDVVLHAAIRYVHNDDAIGVDAPERDQFAFASPPVFDDGDGQLLRPEAFALELGDERFRPRSSVPGFVLATPGVDEAYTDDGRFGRLVFDLSTVDTGTGALVRNGLRRPLPDDVVSRFATAPDFRVLSVDVPASTTPGGTFEVTAKVANDGDAPGTFLAGVQRGGLFETVSTRVEPGATGTARTRLEVHADPGGVEYGRFVHAGVNVSFEVRVEAHTESSEAPATNTADAG